jgi:hypothetical protein
LDADAEASSLGAEALSPGDEGSSAGDEDSSAGVDGSSLGSSPGGSAGADVGSADGDEGVLDGGVDGDSDGDSDGGDVGDVGGDGDTLTGGLVDWPGPGVGLVLPPPVGGGFEPLPGDGVEPLPPEGGGVDPLPPGATTSGRTRVAAKNSDHQTVAIFTTSPVCGAWIILPLPRYIPTWCTVVQSFGLLAKKIRSPGSRAYRETVRDRVA